MILTTLNDYAKQKGITRQRAYQLKNGLNLITLPVFVECKGRKIPLVKDGKPQTHVFVVQDPAELEADLIALLEEQILCRGLVNMYKSVTSRIIAIKNTLEKL